MPHLGLTQQLTAAAEVVASAQGVACLSRWASWGIEVVVLHIQIAGMAQLVMPGHGGMALSKRPGCGGRGGGEGWKGQGRLPKN